MNAYSVSLILFLCGLLAAQYVSTKPKTLDATDHANKYCQALYGPQTGAIFTDTLQCQTVRGEVLPARAP